MTRSHKKLSGPVYVIVPAAGTGSRMNLPHNKQFLQIGRYPVIVRSLLVLEELPEIKGYIVVAAANEVPAMKKLLQTYKLSKLMTVTAGGSTRQQSVANGLQILAQTAIDLDKAQVLVHDGARCFVTAEVIRRVIDGILQHDAAGAAVAVKDTIKQADPDGRVSRTLDRSQLWAMQTPQGAWFSMLNKVYDLATQNGWEGTDDLSLLEMAGYPVFLVTGDYRNIKLTTPEDQLFGEQLASLADQE